MKTKNIVAILMMVGLVLTGCNNGDRDSSTSSNESSSSSSTIEEPISPEVHVYDTNETIFLNGLLSDRYYDLSKMYIHIADEVVTANEFDFKEGNDVSVKNDNRLEYKKTGVTKYTISYGEVTSSLVVTVNDKTEDLGLYKTVDFNNFFDEWIVQQGDDRSFIADAAAQKLAVRSGGSFVLGNLALEESLRKNITLDFDLTLSNALLSSSNYGIVFRQTIPMAYPYYQLNIRRIMNEPASISLLEYTAENTYSLVGISSFDKTLYVNDKIHMTINLDNYNFSLSIDGEEAFTATLNNILEGHVGFHSTGMTYTIENLKIFTPKSNTVASNKNNDFFVSRTSNVPNTFMNLSVSYDSLVDINSKLNSEEVVSTFIKVKSENNMLVAYSKNDLKLTDLYTYMNLIKGKLMPIIQVDSAEEASLLAQFANSYGWIDIIVLSHETAVLKTFKNLSPLNKIGYLTEDDDLNLTSKNVASVCLNVGQGGGNILVVPTDKLNRDFIYMANSRGYVVWAISHDDSKLSSIKAAVSGANLLISSNFDNATAAISLESNSLFKIPVITGHRGDGSNVHYPENSLEGFLWAVENGAQAVEIDIHTTSDQRLAVIHDETTERTSTCNLTVKSSTMERLSQCALKLGSTVTEYKISSFEQVLEAFKDNDKIVVVEIKDNLASTAKLAIDLINKYDMADQIVMIGFNISPMMESKNLNPLIATGYLGSVNVKSDTDYISMNETYNSKGIGLSPNMGTLNQLGMKYSNLRGNIYWVWTFNNSMSDFNNHLANGNICFTTNYVELTKSVNFRLEAKQEEYSIANGSTLTLEGNLFDMTSKSTSTSDVRALIIEGNDLATVSNNTLTAKGTGDVYLILSYRTTLSSGIVYNIYSQVVKVTIA